MVEIDLSGLGTFIPVFGFLLVFVVTYALLGKTKILGENKFIHILISFAISIIFLVSANAINYVKTVVPWFAVFIVSLLLIALIVGLMGGEKTIESIFKPGFAWFIVIVLIIVFLLSAAHVFSDALTKYLGQSPKQFLLKPNVLGAIILGAITLFSAWLLTRKQG